MRMFILFNEMSYPYIVLNIITKFRLKKPGNIIYAFVLVWHHKMSKCSLENTIRKYRKSLWSEEIG